ncbi:YopX family protein [Bacillus atrophaeus]|uniref:YopX family protein n=1 Tax=Bacillus atrophaeus TaxID=1452 RepID=UPI0040416CAB
MNTAYRVWDGEQMHYWDDEGLRLFIDGGEWMLYSARSGEMIFEITNSKNKNAALMWGTGLKDKHDGDIYHKDITEESVIDRYVIERKNGFDKMQQINGKDYRHLWLRIDEVKVIGNVYENPELLEGAE